MEQDQKQKIEISVVVPIYNEEENVIPLYEEIKKSLLDLNRPYEIIFVDDGSKDKTLDLIKSLHPLKILSFRRNFGQTAALSAGFDASEGDIVISMDGDLQNDPADIKNLIEKLNEGFDVVCGWRKNRQDKLSKKFLSRLADKLRRFVLKDKIHDSGCTLRAYRKESLVDLEIYGEMHRFIPAILRQRGFKVTEIVVNHRERRAGKTKYNYKRLLKGMVDVFNVWFWFNYSSRPLHLFGGLGVAMGAIGGAFAVVLAIARIFYGISLQNKIWPLIAIFFILVGLQLFFFGFLADVMIRTYYSKDKKPYIVKEILENENTTY